VTVFLRRMMLAVVATVLVSSAAAAQAGRKEQGDRPLLGPHAEFATNDLDFGIGAQFSYPVANRFDIYPTFDYYFPGNSVHVWTLDGTVRYWPKLNMKNPGLYVGAGLNFTHTSVNTTVLGVKVSGSSDDVGLGLVGGWVFKQVSLLPFGQIRIVIGDADRVEFGGGINFKL
jgi:opacity protein-like surface antigen